MDPTPPRVIRVAPAREVGQSSISFDIPADQSGPISLTTLRSKNSTRGKPERSHAEEEEDDKARIKRLEEEVSSKPGWVHLHCCHFADRPFLRQLSATRKAWHTQITQLESQLGMVKDAMSLAQQEVQSQREKQSHSAQEAGGRFCQRCHSAMGGGDGEGRSDLRGLIVKNP